MLMFTDSNLFDSLSTSFLSISNPLCILPSKCVRFLFSISFMAYLAPHISHSFNCFCANEGLTAINCRSFWVSLSSCNSLSSSSTFSKSPCSPNNSISYNNLSIHELTMFIFSWNSKGISPLCKAMSYYELISFIFWSTRPIFCQKKDNVSCM